ncbi:hypothetical protein [Streptomyces huiliensis]|uniref:hypothetical protein n=1 Tax=Streptomyces huiliensis TaxID=2876027 RepID=UPI001CC1997E|nr:hypothetical protein [Streptomyces huiliensis]MBZ4319561.1 hypothetical protein [Streptomyces huiliensis]
MDHGDDFGAWIGNQHTAPAHRTDEEWADVARYLRHAANKIGPALPLCLPGEPQECGRSAHQHVLAWGAAVKAAAQHVIESAAPAPAHAAYAGGPLYQRRLAELRATSGDG